MVVIFLVPLFEGSQKEKEVKQTSSVFLAPQNVVCLPPLKDPTFSCLGTRSSSRTKLPLAPKRSL